MNSKKNCIIFLILIFAVLHLFSQDVHFSQFYANPLNNSPSNTGLFEADWRISSSYRSQWGAIAEPYNTISLGLEKQFYVYSQKFSGGVYFLNDESGGINLNINKIYISAAYHLEKNYNTFHVGLQFGWVFKMVDQSKMTLPNQFDNSIGYFNSALNSKESIDEHINYPDLNLGIGWTKKYYKYKPYISLSLNHVLYPRETFTRYSNYLYLKTHLTGGVRWDMNNKYFVNPMFNLQLHKNAKEYLMGTHLGYKLQNRPWDIEDVFTGIYLRDPVEINLDALIIVFGIDFSRSFVGVSYDVNLSKLRRATSQRGAFELSFIYTGLNTNMEKRTIPCERF